MIERVPEPEELMDEAAQAAAYAAADFSEPNDLFVALFEALAGHPASGRVVDLGCGPGDIPLQLAQRHPALLIDAVDGAAAMLDCARERLAAAPGPADRVRLHLDLLPCASLDAGSYHWVVSNSLLHHVRDPQTLWQTVNRCGGPGAGVLVMDLARPPSREAADRLVAQHAADTPEVLRRDFHNSLLAAYTPAEVASQLAAAGLGQLDVRMVSDRHLAVSGRLDARLA